MDPSFFKPLVGEFPKKLLIPPAFVEKMEGKLTSKLVLKYECGRLYTIKVEELEEGKFFFTNGWPEFVRDHGLEYGDFVVFRLIEDSTFQVTIYDPSMCEKQCCNSHPNKNDDQAAMKVIKVETITNADQDDPTEPSSLTKKNQESAVKIESDKSMDEESKIPCSNTDAPSFTLLLTEANKIYLPLPSSFVKKTGLARKNEIKVRDPDGKKSVMKIRKDGKGAGLTRGWSDLFIANRLKKGDTCIFKFVSRGGVGFIQVYIRRGRGRPPKNK